MSQTPEDYNKIEAFHHTSASNNPEDIIQNCHVALTAISNEFVKMLSNNKLLKQQLSERDATIAKLKQQVDDCFSYEADLRLESIAKQKRISELERVANVMYAALRHGNTDEQLAAIETAKAALTPKTP